MYICVCVSIEYAMIFCGCYLKNLNWLNRVLHFEMIFMQCFLCILVLSYFLQERAFDSIKVNDLPL